MPEILSKRAGLNHRLSKLEEENQKLQLQLGQLRSLANVGLTFTMAAHEINNVLTPIGNYAQLALDNPDDIELTKKVQKKTVKNCFRAQKILQNLINAANKQPSQKQYHLVQDLMDNVFDCISRDFSKDRIRLNVEIEKDLKIYAVDVDIEQLIMNLVLNARDAMLNIGGTLNIDAYEKSDSIVITISDTGKGIEKQDIKNIFDPFYSTKETHDKSAGGTGLGLAYCKEIVQEYDGTIKVDSQINEGTNFKITFPKNPSLC